MGGSQKTGSTEFGARMVSRRQELGLSRRQLAESTGLSYPYVSQLETGYRLPSTTALRDLAAVLQVSTDELVALMPSQRSVPPRPATGGGWVANPDYSASSPEAPAATAARGRRSRAAVVADAYDLLSSLPPDQRLDALNKVQLALVEGLVHEQTRGARPDEQHGRRR